MMFKFCRWRHALGTLAPLLMLCSLHHAATANYEVHHWTSFEDGRLPADGITVGANPDATHQVIRLASKDSLPNFFNPTLAYELGNYCLKITVDPPNTSAMNGLLVGAPFSRDSLGADGIAIFQADVYVEHAKPKPNIAVLATKPPSDDIRAAKTQPSIGTEFLRLGFTNNEVPYFSYSRPGGTRPVLFLQDRDLLPLVPTPGWRRLMLVVSRDRVRGYIDGRGMVFNPHPLPDMRTIIAGVLLTESKLPYSVYIDNISVQVARENVRMPESPFAEDWTIPAGEAARKGGEPHTGAIRDKRWMNPYSAWQTAQQSRRPMLLLFCSPGLERSDAIERRLSEHEATPYLDKHVLARIDINQVKGNKIAQDYKVFKVPTIIVISPDANDHRRIVPEPNSSIPAIFQALQL